MKKRFAIIPVFAIATMVMFTACGEQEKTDETFIKNLSSGLNARWTYSDSNTDDLTDNAKVREYFSTLCKKESDKIGAYEDYTFTDPTLAEYAEAYITALQSQTDSAQYYGNDEETYNDMFIYNGHYPRMKYIYLINESYPLNIKDSNVNAFDESIQLGRNLYTEDERLTALNNSIAETSSLYFDGSYFYFEMDNLSEYEYEDVMFNFSFYDEDGKLVYQTSNSAEEIPANEHIGGNIWSEDYTCPTAKMYASYTRDYGEETLQTAVTDTCKISIENDYIVNIELAQELPADFSTIYSYSGTQCTVTVKAIEIKESYWTDGLATYEVFVEGQKMYDIKGESHSDYCMFGWRLKDESGTIVDSGTVLTSDIMTGESFKNESFYINSITPGNYTLEFMDYVS